jgi:hypothetical protein
MEHFIAGACAIPISGEGWFKKGKLQAKVLPFLGRRAPEPRLEPGSPNRMTGRGMEGHIVCNTKIHHWRR